MLNSVLQYAHFLLAFFVIFLVFIQPAKGGLGNLLSSGGGLENKKFDFMTKFTLTIILLFIGVSAAMVYLQAHQPDETTISMIQTFDKEIFKHVA